MMAGNGRSKKAKKGHDPVRVRRSTFRWAAKQGNGRCNGFRRSFSRAEGGCVLGLWDALNESQIATRLGLNFGFTQCYTLRLFKEEDRRLR